MDGPAPGSPALPIEIPSGNRRAGERRRHVALALRSCILETGYAATSLTDIAIAAGMSPSHVLYYFTGKAAILAHLVEGMSDELRERVLETEVLEPEARIDALADVFFGRGGTGRDELAIFLETFGVAVRDEQVRAVKTSWDASVRRSLARLFARCEGLEGRAVDDAAESALAAVIGLATGSYFGGDDRFVRARRILRATLRRFAGLRVEAEEERT